MPDGFVRMISEARHEYAGKWHEAGDEFNCDERDVRVLLALGRARVIPVDPKNGLEYETRVMTARGRKRGKTLQ